jgi:glyoxylase-like metal-dependent hydrolase (beta-lactamase superfamily II)
MTHVISKATSLRDTLFMPDGGLVRRDFPGGDAEEPDDSIQKVLAPSDEMRL